MNHRIVSYIFLSVLAGSLFAQAGNPPARPAPGTRPVAPAAASPSAAAPAQNPASPAAVVRPETIKTVYVTINGAKQGVLGKGKIRLLKYDFQLSRARNAATPAGTSAPAISITKSWDAASAPLLQALEINENLNMVTFEFMAIAADGREQPAFTIKLTNATVIFVNQSVDASGPGSPSGPGGLEEVHFTYQKLDFQDLFNRSAAEIGREGSL
jgi:type VI secretion system Hcp family effector